MQTIDGVSKKETTWNSHRSQEASTGTWMHTASGCRRQKSSAWNWQWMVDTLFKWQGNEGFRKWDTEKCGLKFFKKVHQKSKIDNFFSYLLPAPLVAWFLCFDTLRTVLGWICLLGVLSVLGHHHLPEKKPWLLIAGSPKQIFSVCYRAVDASGRESENRPGVYFLRHTGQKYSV